MRSKQRSLIAFLATGIVLLALAGVLGLGTARLAAEDDAGDIAAESAAGGPHIQSYQKPRIQDFFAGGDATFTVSITNTGSIPFQSVNVTNATTSNCLRSDLGPLAPGEVKSYTCGAEDVGESFLNELQVNGTTDTAMVVSHGSNAFVKVLKPQLRLTKQPDTRTVRRGATAPFTIALYNTSDFIMVVDEIDDSIVADCDRVPTITIYLIPQQTLSYPCYLTNVQAPQATVATGWVSNPLTGIQYFARDVAFVELIDLQATLTPQTAAIPEPGDVVTFTVDLVNSGSVPITLISLSTDRYGNLFDPNNPLVEAAENTCLPQDEPLPTLPPNGAGYSCTFQAAVSGQPSNFAVALTATAIDKDGLDVSATATGTVVIIDLPSSLTLSLSANPPFISPPDGVVTFSVRVQNTSAADSISVTAMNDEFLGSLNGQGNCALPAEYILPGFSYQCRFSATVAGELGQQKSRTISVTAVDDDLPPKTLVAAETVTIGVTDQPPQAIFMPSVTDDTVEPNNSCSRPYPLLLNRQYYFRPPALYPSDQDYYSFELTQSANVRVEMTNFVPRKGQMVVRKGDGCLTVVARNTEEALNKTLNLGQQAAGRYYIQIINDNAVLQGNLDFYGLIVRVN